MKRLRIAPPCTTSKRHKWGQETGYTGYPTNTSYRPCTICGIRQHIRYTKNGNHINGYDK